MKKVNHKSTKNIKKIEDKNLFVIENYYLLRFGEIKNKVSGDFIDNMVPKLNLIVADVNNQVDQENLVIFNKHFGCQIYKNKVFFEVVDEVVKMLPAFIDFPKGLLTGLAQSTYDQDCDGIIDHAPSYENKFFVAGDSDSVKNFENSFFGIGSVTHDTGAKFNIKTNEVIHINEKLGNLTELYGRINEDSSWVVGVAK